MIFGVIAGTKREFEGLIKDLTWQIEQSKIKVRFSWNLRINRVFIGGSELFFVQSVNQIRGLKPFYPIFYGSFYQRSDIFEVSQETMIRNIERKLEELQDEARQSIIYKLGPELIDHSGVSVLSTVLKERTEKT
jgi:hypothetical protein